MFQDLRQRLQQLELSKRSVDDSLAQVSAELASVRQKLDQSQREIIDATNNWSSENKRNRQRVLSK